MVVFLTDACILTVWRRWLLVIKDYKIDHRLVPTREMNEKNPKALVYSANKDSAT